MLEKCPKCGSMKVSSKEWMSGYGAAAEGKLPPWEKRPPENYCEECGYLWLKKNKNPI